MLPPRGVDNIPGGGSPLAAGTGIEYIEKLIQLTNLAARREELKMHARFATLLLSVGLVSCSKKPVPRVEAEPAPPAVAQSAPQPTAPVDDSRQRIREILDRVFQPVYFPFDQATLSSEARKLLSEAATLLAREPSIRVTIQGNTDDLGTAEYNLALGQRRAAVVRDYLAGFGIEPSRLQIISYGEEKPAREGVGEESRALNRRDDFQVVF
jgi:peptidoglycan-associated lipoprotein